MEAKRPLSPHLQIYRLPLTAWLSISHRVSGAILSLGLVALTLVLLAAAQSPAYYEAIRGVLASWIGKGGLFIWLLALFVHFCHGIRHLVWDLGLGFAHLSLARHSRWELLAAVGLTVLAWVMVVS